MRTKAYFVATILLIVAPAALADSIEVTINSSVQVSGIGNDNFFGFYSTLPDSSVTSYQTPVGVNVNGTITFPNYSFFLPSGSVVTSASMQYIVPTTPIVGTGTVFIASEGLPPPDENGPHTPPTLLNPETVTIYPAEDFPVFLVGGTPGVIFPPNTPIVSGDEISTGTFDLLFVASASESYSTVTPGYNWAGYVDGEAQGVLPLSVQIDVDYTLAPEPPSFILVGTAMLGLVGVARRKRLV
jgi:hypothetical protein